MTVKNGSIKEQIYGEWQEDLIKRSGTRPRASILRKADNAIATDSCPTKFKENKAQWNMKWAKLRLHILYKLNFV